MLFLEASLLLEVEILLLICLPSLYPNPSRLPSRVRINAFSLGESEVIFSEIYCQPGQWVRHLAVVLGVPKELECYDDLYTFEGGVAYQ